MITTRAAQIPASERAVRESLVQDHNDSPAAMNASAPEGLIAAQPDAAGAKRPSAPKQIPATVETLAGKDSEK
jgi:hypothetical protein